MANQAVCSLLKTVTEKNMFRPIETDIKGSQKLLFYYQIESNQAELKCQTTSIPNGL